MCIRDRRRVHGDSKIKRKKEISMIGQVVHRFVRNPTYAGTIHNRVANRGSPFQNTLTVLEDPKNGRKLYLIGTTNSSTTLAQRTRRLIQDVKPDSVLVMANEKWWNMIKDVKNVDSQQELNHYNLLLNGAYEFKYPNNARGLIFKLRLYPWLFFLNWFNSEFSIPSTKKILYPAFTPLTSIFYISQLRDYQKMQADQLLSNLLFQSNKISILIKSQFFV
eukprot:TRINITY_DN787_c0_g1_i13.p1 TRINITY_DN787_c0_g1~~TRINITY_DN787_c0_g1_i13.p1  ORF type:complete len:220 (-),score=56.29 TRINITY_DN787_c0_g1_i13:82-741(-)